MITEPNSSLTLGVAVLAGGDSHEREISLASGAEAVTALEAAGHHVELFDPATVGLDEIPWSRFDVCFIALHGGPGEDGRIQRQLEQLGVAYTGSPPAASRLAMSKSAAKERFFQAGIPTLPYAMFHATESIDHVVAQVGRFGYPLVIKPDSQGSSLGVGFAQGPDDLQPLVAEAGRFDPYILAEMYLAGREFTVAVLDRRALPLLEIATNDPVFSYQAKYHTSSNADLRFDTGLSTEKIAQLQQTAVAAAASLETSGLVRVDLLLDAAGWPWVLEVNTVPGMTRTSLAPRAAVAAGLEMPALCDWMVRDALRAGVVR